MDREQELKEQSKQTIGRAIRAMRIKKDMTLEDLAASSNLHSNFLGDVERGKKDITTFNLYKIAAGLELENPHELLMDTTHTVYPNILELSKKWK